jgi:hypothetical protein
MKNRSHATDSDQLQRELAALSALNVKQLKDRWRSVYGFEPFFAPSIVEAICEGRQPPDLTAKRLRRAIMPYRWTEQYQALGLRVGNS